MNPEDTTIEDIKKALELIGYQSSSLPCICDYLSKHDVSGCCLQHNLIKLSKEQHDKLLAIPDFGKSKENL